MTKMRKIAREIRSMLLAIVGSDLRIKPDLDCEKQRFGSEYGGWEVATGSLTPQTLVYSFGVGEDASFDTALIEHCHLTIHAFDPTPKSVSWARKQGFPANFVLHEYGLAAFDGTVSFNPPENPDHVSHTLLDRPSTQEKSIKVPVKRLKTIMSELGHQHIDILKMDIEGAEYDVIRDICDSGIRPAQILVEFHHRFPGVGVGMTKRAIRQIRSMGYGLFSVSPSKEEYSFIRNSNEMSA